MRSAVESLIGTARLPSDRGHIRPLCEQRVYRGKYQWVVGYTWSKIGSNPRSGTVYDAVLGWGDTFDAALEKARTKVVVK